jgi:hypothetical protein
MDFGFMRASTSDFSCPNKNTDRVVTSYDGFSSYLLIVDEATRFIWVFLTKSKAPPLDILDSFFARFGHEHGGSVRTDQGGELAQSFALSNLLLRKHRYVMEPTGADSPSQNGAGEIYNNKLAVRTRTLLYVYGAGLPAKYWSSALQHSVYLHNRLVHTVTTPRRLHSRYSMDINLTSDTLSFSAPASALKFWAFDVGNWIVMISRVYSLAIQPWTTTSSTLISTQASSSHCHHAQINKAWYLQSSRLPPPGGSAPV